MAVVNPNSNQSERKYQRHEPEKTTLYKIVNENLDDFYAKAESRADFGLPSFVKKDFNEFLKCGILKHGFLRAKCDSCKHENLIPFSCKKRGFCPSCGTKRMVESAAHLVDKVIPNKPVRQWVITFPYQIRFILAQNPKIMSDVLSIVNKSISSYIVKKSGQKTKSAKTGAVTYIQRFGGALNLNIHFHCIFLDGAYSFDNPSPKFHCVPPPTKEDIDSLLVSIVSKVIRKLERLGLIVKDETNQKSFSINSTGIMDEIQASSISYKVAFGKRKGEKALTLQTIPATDRKQSRFLSKYSQFSLHAGVSCSANDRKKLERICRYVARSSLSEERLSINARGQVVYKMKTAYDNGTTHIILDPLDFLSRLASLIPRPRVNLTRFHGVFASNFKMRSSIVPKPRLSLVSSSPGNESKKKSKNPSAMTWAQRLNRVFQIDITVCPLCQGNVSIIACIQDPDVIRKILTHLKLNSFASATTRGPPLSADEGKAAVEHQFETQGFPDYDLPF